LLTGLLTGGSLEMDESLLTGESDLIRKAAGDEIFSGSFCVTGDGYFEAEKVGSESFANKLTEAARSFAPLKTPLQQSINYKRDHRQQGRVGTAEQCCGIAQQCRHSLYGQNGNADGQPDVVE